MIGPERAEHLAHVHPESFGSGPAPAFRLVAAASSVRLLGDVDPHDVPRLVRLLARIPHAGELTVDLTGAGYVHHGLFAALEGLPTSVAHIRVVGAREVLRRVWGVVGRPAGRVDLV